MHFADTVRPDISYGVHSLAQFVHKPNKSFWTAGKHILRYLKETITLGIMYHHEDENKLEVFSEANWRYEKPTPKSISGYLFIR